MNARVTSCAGAWKRDLSRVRRRRLGGPAGAASEAHMCLQQRQDLMWVNSEQRRGLQVVSVGSIWLPSARLGAEWPSSTARRERNPRWKGRLTQPRFCFQFITWSGRTITGPHRPVQDLLQEMIGDQWQEQLSPLKGPRSPPVTDTS